MARGTMKKIVVAVNKPGRKAATASALALQKQHVIEQKKTAQAEGISADGESDIDAYSHAFDIIPNKYSASALELFLVQKGLTEGWSLSTTWGIFLAFKDMWKDVKGETYCGPYHCDEGTGVVTGNPALSAAAQDMMEVLKNNEGAEGGSRNHASAMTIEDMQKLMAWSYSQCPDGIVSHIHQSIEGRSTLEAADVILAQRHLMVCAFSPTGITIWTRNFELTKIKQKICHEYEVYAQPKTPEICMFTHLRAWVSFLEEVLLQRPLQPEEYIFPRVSANGVVYPSDELSYDAVMKTLTWICTEAGLIARYTSHCFRRGGARYWFMFAPLGEHWSLATIRWWGAWAEGESVDTLIQYLLDELTRYEKNQQDTLCPIPQEGDKSFNGDHILTAPVTAAETRELKMSFDHELNRLSGKVEEVLDKLTLSPASSPYPSLLPSPSQPLILVQPTLHHQAAYPTSLLSNAETSSTPSPPVPVDSASSPSSHIIPTLQVPPSDCRQHSHTAAKKTAPKKMAPIPSVGIPDLPRGQEALLAAVKQWEDPATSIGGKALKDWPEEWYTGPMCTITGMKRNICKVIAIEFYRLQQDHQVFLPAYPEATRGVKPLFDAIQRQREGCREITGRASKNGRPEVRASSSH
ncbi:hypothetical protein CY34DRAFT_17678 [Suillus luteus UH-Slu-Lm8-n1]|uniref:Uncharacterized protein n=1 Tax=Suillus luteus UH-Slu-Lm8-n1 TaxID=930992 RepID=A0A0D0ARE9_9AGAM|nr:hypothetical protein CY34DRAFT_17678 [Suillus luteus UH-Slu-Lm8-n1]